MNSATDEPEPRHPASVFTASIKRRALVEAYPELNPVCDQLGFGWQAPLKDQVETPDRSLLELARAAQTPYVAFSRDWRQADIIELIEDIIANHHAPLRNELRRLEILMAKAMRHCPELGQKSFHQHYEAFANRQLAHLDQEEYVIFPLCVMVAKRRHAMETHDKQQIRTSIGEMSNGHVDAEAFLISLMAQLHPYIGHMRDDLSLIGSGMAAMQEDLSVHHMKEDGILVPALYSLAG